MERWILKELKNSPVLAPREDFFRYIDFSDTLGRVYNHLKTRFNVSSVWQTAIVRSTTRSSFCNGRDCCFAFHLQ